MTDMQAKIERLRTALNVERQIRDGLEVDKDRLERELAEARDNWWKHPNAQLVIGGKARLSLRLQHIESIVNGTPRDDIGIDDDYWCDLCEKVLAMRDKLAEARELLRRVAYVYPPHNDCRCGMIDDVDAFLAATATEMKP